ncbi:hypothetical protein WG68_18760 [Arsukibacterium ikkense]|uniref:Uncharacterized protein n=1 Tax=Arsukibacterium ikkense TaxID=336831 RepID=A0A0M2V3S4_9GAMM|nr:hypothetical protein [Arsukibacterium ikkense]KKO43813.1 hypothetical protein WG68_18760 [Arsukibacterium ikkense]
MINNSVTFIHLDTDKDFFDVAEIENNREANRSALAAPATPNRTRTTEHARGTVALDQSAQGDFAGAVLFGKQHA